MSRFCERPGCSTPASIAYGIDHDRLVVWLDVLAPTPDADVRVGVLCRRHADAMVVPLGWMLDDLREPTPRLFKVAETATTAVVRRRRASPNRGAPSEQLELAAPALPVTSHESSVDDQIAELLDDDTAQMQRTVLRAELARIAAATRSPEAGSERAPRTQPEQSPNAVAAVAAEAPSSPSPSPSTGREREQLSDREPSAESETDTPGGSVAASSWSPVFDEADDLGGLLTANSPLLSRAFGTGRGGSAGAAGSRQGEKHS